MKTFCLLFLMLTGLQVHGLLIFEQEEIVHEAGLLEEKTEAIFRFTNTGDQPLTISNVSSSCGCTVPKLEKDYYLPGEGGEIRALFTYGARVGTQRKRITVQTGGQTYALNMVTKIPDWITIEPRILRWKIGETATPKDFTIRVSQPDKIRLELLHEALKGFRAEVDEVAPGHYIVTVAPRSVSERATEFLQLTAIATEGGASRSRQFVMHCLVR